MICGESSQSTIKPTDDVMKMAEVSVTIAVINFSAPPRTYERENQSFQHNDDKPLKT
jgi:hypothetical protein